MNLHEVLGITKSEFNKGAIILAIIPLGLIGGIIAVEAGIFSSNDDNKLPELPPHITKARNGSDPEAPEVEADYAELIEKRIEEKIKGMTMKEIQALPSNETFRVIVTETGTYIHCYPLQYDINLPTHLWREPYHLAFWVYEGKDGALHITPESKQQHLEALMYSKPSTKLPGGIILPF